MPRAGFSYAARRNLDLPGTTSGLSFYLRHRLLTEEEVIRAARAMHGRGADRFVTEVLWRTYFKGWLEQHPSVWRDYLVEVEAARNRLATETGLRAAWEGACRGETGIDGFDQWAQRLTAEGWLHNHARMWFASIWIFTLRLPWALGADFFLRHLVDGDPASNTLSWRWVAGLHTAGKHYLADAETIHACTEGAFRPQGLVMSADPLPYRAPPDPVSMPTDGMPAPNLATAWLRHSDDLGSEAGGPVLAATAGLSPLALSQRVHDLTLEAASGSGDPFDADRPGALDALATRLAADGTRQVVTLHAPVGPVADALNALEARLAVRGITLVRRLRPWDAAHWPEATRGFYRFRKRVMPTLTI